MDAGHKLGRTCSQDLKFNYVKRSRIERKKKNIDQLITLKKKCWLKFDIYHELNHRPRSRF